VWGRAILTALLAMLLLPAAPAEASGPRPGKAKAVSAQKQAARAARIARRHVKLDLALNDAVEDQANGQSNVIIEFNDESDSVNLVKAFGGKSGRRLGLLKARVAKLSNRQLKALANDKRVKRIHLDRPVKGFMGRTAVTVGARAVQELMGYTGAGVGVAVVDSGITGWHDDLTDANGNQRVARFVDFVNGYTQPYDDWGHGTHVAGIVAGNGYDTNGLRTAIAPGAHIVALKALDQDGNGTISNIIAAIDYAVANKDALNIRVINLSLGAGVYESYNTDPLTVAAKRAVDAGIVVVAAAGNLGKAANGLPQYGAIGSPGNAPWVITVGASSTNGTVRRQDDTMAAFSSRGPTMIDYAAKPDLVAPGYGTISLSDPISKFYTTKAQFLLPGQVATNYQPYLALSGTSMSAPVVAGTVALMLQANPNLTPNLVKAMLQFTAQEYPGYDVFTQGAGFLNARGAVRLAEYFRTGHRGSAYPSMTGWSKQIFWGNRRVKGGVLTPGGTAWYNNVVWGALHGPNGMNIVWGDNCADSSCDNIVWGNNIVWGESDDDNIVWGNDGDDNIVWGNNDDDNIVWGNGDDDNIVWGNGDDDNIVWGNDGDDNIVWGNDCGGADCDNIVWGNSDDDNIVWGNAEGLDNIVWGNGDDDNIVWGNSDDDNIVWGNSEDDNIVWGNDGDDNIVWGNTVDQAVQQLSFEGEINEVNSLPSSMWDALFPLDAQWPATTDTTEQPNTNESSEPPADNTTVPPSDSTTVPPADNTTVPPTDDTTVPPTDDTTVPPADNTTVPPTDSTYVPPTDNTTVPPTDSTTVPPTDDTTVPPADNTTVPPTDSTYVPPTDNTTVPPTDSTTVPPTDSTTVPPTDSTTVPPTDNTTVPPTDNTTVPPTDSTTVPPTDGTTVPPAGTGSQEGGL
jgi:serine protease AprX